MILPIERNVVLVRKYQTANKQLVSYPQCKVLQINGEFVAFRDIYGNKSRLFRDNSWNVDHIIFEWLKLYGVKKIYYYECKNKRLFRITVQIIENALKRKDTYQEKLNNHTQIFIPRFLWKTNPSEKNEVLIASRRWIKDEVDVALMGDTFDRLEKREAEVYINYDVKKKLAEMWRAKYA
jgi:hypothetical protein